MFAMDEEDDPKKEQVKRLKEHLTFSQIIKHEDQIMKLTSLKDAHIYCLIHNITGQRFGNLLEKYIRLKFGYTKNNASQCVGDGSKDGKNIEIKASLGSATKSKSRSKYNYVQIRPNHNCDTYILTAYHVSSENVENSGELYIFKISKAEIVSLIATYGCYAHGTIKEHGKITIESINDKTKTKMYALRPTINKKCWNALLAFRITESML